MEKNVATEVGARERLSKAIYFHHPTRDSRNTVPEPLPSACGFPYAFDGETDDKREKRSDAYLECWGVIEGLIDYHTNDLYSQLYGDVNKFVRRASVAFNKRTAIVEQSEPRTNTAHVDSINNTTATGTDNTPGVPSAVHTPSKLFSGSSYGRYDTLSVSEIPTALLHTGSNVSDHPVLLNQISHNLMLGSTPGESQVETHSFARGPRPCVLKGDECTTLQTTVKNIVQSFTNVTDDGSSAQIAAIDTTYANAQDFWQLHMWYTARYAPVREANSGDGPTSAGTGAERGSGKPGETDANRTASTDAGTSPPVDGSTQGTTSVASDTAAHTPTPTYTAKHTQLRYPPLVVLFDDFERFSGPLLDALIHICRQWLPSLPFVFIFSIASYFDRVHDVLNRTSLSALNMTRLTLQTAKETVSFIMNSTLMDATVPVALAHFPFQSLLDCFLFYRTSVAAFTSGLRGMILEHFAYNPLAMLCTTATGDEHSAVIASMSMRHCQEIRNLKSIRRYIEFSLEDTPDKQIYMLTSDAYLKQQIEPLVESVRAYRMTLVPMLRCFLAVLQLDRRFGTEDSVFGTRIRDLYASVLQQSVSLRTEYERAIEVLWSQSPEQVLQLLETCIANFEGDDGQTEGEGGKEQAQADARLHSHTDRWKALKAMIRIHDHISELHENDQLYLDHGVLTEPDKTCDQHSLHKHDPRVSGQKLGGLDRDTSENSRGGEEVSSTSERDALVDRKIGPTVSPSTHSDPHPHLPTHTNGTKPPGDTGDVPTNNASRESIPNTGSGGRSTPSARAEMHSETTTGAAATRSSARASGKKQSFVADALTTVDTSMWSAAKRRRMELLKFSGLGNSLLPANLRKRSNFEAARDELVGMLDKLFRRHLVSPSTLPLYEVFFHQPEGGRGKKEVCPRSIIQQRIAKPQSLLRNLPADDILSDSLPDVVIAYRLHLECGRYINLTDWMEAFACVIEPDLDMIVDEGDDIPLNPKTPKKRKRSLAQVKAAAMEKRQMELRRALQARFTAAVRDMQFLGFIRSTKRKVDHVERLTWGHA